MILVSGDRRTASRLEAVERVKAVLEPIIRRIDLDSPTTEKQRDFASTLDEYTRRGGYSGPELLRLERLLRALIALLHSN